MDVFALNGRLGRGVNVFGYDPAWSAPGQRRMQDEHFRLIKQAGFSHVRIPLHPFQHMAGAGEDYRVAAEWFAVLDWALERALANGLMVILDCHEYNSMARDPEGLKPNWLAFWRQMAPRHAGAPDTVLFELLNEPNHALTPEMWNAFLVEGLALVRESNPDRAVIIGPGEWNGIGELGKLVLPEGDRNIVATVHYYDPHLFTHQGAAFEGRGEDVGYEWNGTESERGAIERDFRIAQQWAKKHARPILLGEFGAYRGGRHELARAMDLVRRAAGRIARLELVLLAVRRRLCCLQHRCRQVGGTDSRRAHSSEGMACRRARRQGIAGSGAADRSA